MTTVKKLVVIYDLPMVCGGTAGDAGVAGAVSVRTEHVETSDLAHDSSPRCAQSGHQLIVL